MILNNCSQEPKTDSLGLSCSMSHIEHLSSESPFLASFRACISRQDGRQAVMCAHGDLVVQIPRRMSTSKAFGVSRLLELPAKPQPNAHTSVVNLPRSSKLPGRLVKFSIEPLLQQQHLLGLHKALSRACRRVLRLDSVQIHPTGH